MDGDWKGGQLGIVKVKFEFKGNGYSSRHMRTCAALPIPENPFVPQVLSHELKKTFEFSNIPQARFQTL